MIELKCYNCNFLFFYEEKEDEVIIDDDIESTGIYSFLKNSERKISEVVFYNKDDNYILLSSLEKIECPECKSVWVELNYKEEV